MTGVSKRSYILNKGFFPPKSDKFYDFSVLATFIQILYRSIEIKIFLFSFLKLFSLLKSKECIHIPWKYKSDKPIVFSKKQELKDPAGKK